MNRNLLKILRTGCGLLKLFRPSSNLPEYEALKDSRLTKRLIYDFIETLAISKKLRKELRVLALVTIQVNLILPRKFLLLHQTDEPSIPYSFNKVRFQVQVRFQFRFRSISSSHSSSSSNSVFKFKFDFKFDSISFDFDFDFDSDFVESYKTSTRELKLLARTFYPTSMEGSLEAMPWVLNQCISLICET
jgi:hypothetical protein